MGPAGRRVLIGHFPCRALIDLLYILLSLLCFYPQYLLNIPYTKIRGFGMQTSYYPFFEKLAMHFSPLDIP